METIYKLQPNRTIHLRGFDGRGAAAALYAASETGFTVSGVFRDAADFAVLIVWDADCFFEHPRMKYLPDFDFSGMVLTFDVRYRNLQPLDSPKFPDIDWPFLDVIRADASGWRVRLFDHATLVGGSYEHASGSFTVVTPVAAAAFDRVTLWFQNVAYDYIATGGETADFVAGKLAILINAGVPGGTFSLSAVATGATITITASPAGYDGNMITMYAIAKNANLTTSAPSTKFIGGSSDARWRVSLDFSGLAIDQVRQMWLTFAPQLGDSAAYAGAEWDAVFSNWSVSDPKNVRPLKVAAQNSVRVEETDAGCSFKGKWSSEAGFFSQGFAQVSHSVSDSVSVTYNCQLTHDLWLGTSLYSDRGKLGVSLDGDAESVLDCYLAAEPSVVTRRKLRSAIAPGQHTLVLTVRAANPASAGNFCYFDFLEAVVAGDVPDAPGDFPLRSPALDYDTDHTYKHCPQRILWWYDSLGLTGPMNEYIGVFWWNQRSVTGAVIPSATVTMGGVFADGDQVFVSIGGQAIGKTVFPADTLATIAAHFAYFINATYSGVWASAAGPVLTVSARAATAAFSFTLSAAAENSFGAPSAAGTVAIEGSLGGGVVGTWAIDPAQDPPLNYAVRQWHADFYAEVAKRATSDVPRTVVSAYSMELVDPPSDWIARFPDGAQVLTDTGFASLKSAQCAPLQSGFVAYQTRVYIQTAQLMLAAGLTPEVQFGEFLWWFFASTAGMAYYDAETAAAALAALGRPLHTFLTPEDDPGVNGHADADFLASRLAGHVAAIAAGVAAAVPGTLFELLWPADVNAPKPTGSHGLGGRLNYWVNLPKEWRTKGVLDRFKIEALDWGSGTRSLDLALEAIRLPRSLGWPLEAIRYLYPVFNGGCPWEAEYLLAVSERIPAMTPFAMDHCLLFGWRVEEPSLAPSAQLV
jgi:hypothetical protein